MASEPQRKISRRVRIVGEDGRTVVDLPEGGVVDVVGEAPWVRVRFGLGTEGYVSRGMLDAEAPLSTSHAASDSAEPATLPNLDVPREHPSRTPADTRHGIAPYPTAGTCFVGPHVLEAHVDFHPLLTELDGIASTVGVGIYVTHSFRRHGAAIGGAVVPPATRSNHLAGHAIDMNLMVEGELIDSTRLHPSRHADLPGPARLFLSGVRSHDVLRWGGDFLRPDPVHIDDDLSRRSPALWQQKFVAVQGSLGPGA